MPSQRGVVSVEPEQLTVPQVVALDGNWHAPAPLHVPPQVPVPAHSLAGSLPALMFVQVPTLPVRLHALQASVHAAAQQTPSAQKPLAHWFAPVHAWLFASLATQAVPVQ
jgi:hypothetical protein